MSCPRICSEKKRFETIFILLLYCVFIDGVNVLQHVKIVGMALQYALIEDSESALAAGLDAFLLRPAIDETDYQLELVDVSSSRGGRGGAITEVSLDNAQLRSQRKAYESFLKRVLIKVVDRIIFKVELRSNVDMAAYGAILGYLDIPDGFASPDLSITGTLAQVNHVLRKVYYFAPNNTNGDVILLAEARDTPHYDCIKVPRPLTVTRPLYALYKSGDSDSVDETETLHSACASTAGTMGHTVGFKNRTLPIRVMHLNQPPEVHLSAGIAFSAKVDISISGLGIYVTDVDNDDMFALTSFGSLQSAPIFVTVVAVHGKVSLPNRDNLSFVVGAGIIDSRISFRGAIGVVNAALAQMQYICRATEGCGSHYTDKLTVTVNDDGFFGRGGPMSDTKSVSISIE